jgi:hypothetical protein
MYGKTAVTAVRVAVIGTLMAAGLGAALPAQAAVGTVHVPCRTQDLASAIISASSGETLSLAAGCTYMLTQSLPEVSQDLTIAGHGSTLERSYQPGTAAFTILTTDSGTLAVSDLSFRHGRGALSVTGFGQLTVHGGTFTANTAADGGAIDSENPIDAPELTDVTFTANTSTGSGGAVYNYSPSASLTMTHCTFTGNKAGNSGGAFFEYGLGEGEDAVTDSTFQDNTAAYGGALALSEDSSVGLADVVIRGNSASEDGGGIEMSANNADIDNSRISGNHAGGQGGGIYSNIIPPWQVTSSAIKGNSAADGGGVYNAAASSAFFTGSTISGNHAKADGGGIYNQTGTGDEVGFVSLTDSTISRNTGEYGGGIYNQGTADLAGSQIVRNRAPGGGGGIYDDGSLATVTLTTSSVLGNKPDNCEPPGSIIGCTG